MCYIASRLPLLPLGFSSDADAWTLAANARGFVLRGEYRISRVPGHPLHEWLQSIPIVVGGPLSANTLTLILSGALIIVSERLARRLGVTEPRTAALALAVHPLFWITSADSTDFVMAALLGNGALLAAVSGAPLKAGILLALGTATRVEILAFALPLAVLLPPRHRWRVLGLASFVALALYVPAVFIFAQTPGTMGDLVTSRHSLLRRLAIFAVHGWAACGLVPSLVVLGLLVRHGERLRSAIRGRDPVAVCAGLLGGAYLVITLAHPGKSTYYVPLLPLMLLALVHIASRRWGIAMIVAFCSYAFVYPDLIDRYQGGVRLGFRWNNGLVVKDWVSRWNTAHAARCVEASRPRGEGVLVLGFWLPPWRFAHQDAPRVAALKGGIQVDSRDNEAFETPDGVRVVHKLDRAAAESLAAAGLLLAYGEDIDSFLQQTYGYDIAALGAVAVPVRELGDDVAERFTLHALVGCGLRPGPFVPCVRSWLGLVRAVGE